MILPRSLPSNFGSSTTPPVHIDTIITQATTMTKESSILTFTKTTLLPILIALLLYLTLFHFLLPLYRKHRARYSQYLPLTTTTNLTSRLPSPLQPSTLRASLLSLFLPSRYASTRHQRRTSTASTLSTTNSNILTDEHGEAMVGFDYSNNTGSIEDQNRRRRDAMERQVARGLQAAREMNMGANDARDLAQINTSIPPERRLSRELEEVFRDDSDDADDEDGPNAVTVGRRSMSMSR